MRSCRSGVVCEVLSAWSMQRRLVSLVVWPVRVREYGGAAVRVREYGGVAVRAADVSAGRSASPARRRMPAFGAPWPSLVLTCFLWPSTLPHCSRARSLRRKPTPVLIFLYLTRCFFT